MLLFATNFKNYLTLSHSWTISYPKLEIFIILQTFLLYHAKKINHEISNKITYVT